MRFIFVLVFVTLLTSSDIFAWDRFDCSEDRSGFIILNCRKGENCRTKKVIYDVDIFCGVKEVYNVSMDNVYRDTEDVSVGIKQNYILWKYSGGNSDTIIYNEYQDVEKSFKEKVLFFCVNTMKMDKEGDKCWKSVYEIDGKEVKFNKSLKGKDPVYDWVMKNMPKNRPNAKYIDFGPDIDSSQFTIY